MPSVNVGTWRAWWPPAARDVKFLLLWLLVGNPAGSPPCQSLVGLLQLAIPLTALVVYAVLSGAGASLMLT